MYSEYKHLVVIATACLVVLLSLVSKRIECNCANPYNLLDIANPYNSIGMYLTSQILMENSRIHYPDPLSSRDRYIHKFGSVIL